MRYRVTQAMQPFKLIPTIREEGKTKLLLNLKVQADFQDDRKATSVVIKFPVPSTTAAARISVSKGRARFEPGERAIVWRISAMPGRSEVTMQADVDLMPSTRGDKQWVRPPISMDFQIQMLSISGVQVRFLKVYEKSSYTTNRWVRYLSKAGEYQQRI